jgi:hypothetical protein
MTAASHRRPTISNGEDDSRLRDSADDASGVTHGLFFVPPNNFFTFDFADSTFTSLNGISNQGNITGRYVDASGIAHGFIARVRGTPPTKAAGPETKPNSRSLVAPLNRSPSA